jgi:hypothetical protein
MLKAREERMLVITVVGGEESFDKIIILFLGVGGEGGRTYY